MERVRFNLCLTMGDYLTILGIVFIVLRLTGTIEWSWWLVLAPIWIPWALYGILYGLLELSDIILKRKKGGKNALD